MLQYDTMKPKKTDLDEALKNSLRPPSPPPPVSGAVPPPPMEGPPPALPARLTATISLHGEEQEKAVKILEVLLKLRRKGGGLSDAVKIALQLCPLDPEQIEAAWERSRAQDGRSRKR